MKIAVIGGGASGHVAAITAAERGHCVAIYERCDKAAKKILATGNGRCNMSNVNAELGNYHGANPKFVSGAMHRFWVDETLEFFKRLGIVAKIEENGKVFPYSYRAAAVSDVLRSEAERLGVKTVCGFEAANIKRTKNGFEIISTSKQKVFADKVILATGGKASPNLGSNGSGYALAEKFGHKTTKLFPTLVQIKTDNTYTKALRGQKVEAAACFLKNGKPIKSSSGEVLFTDYGLSGPPVFDLSRLASTEKDGEIGLDLMPEYSVGEVLSLLAERKYPEKTLDAYFVGMLEKRIGNVLLKSCGIAPLSEKSGTLSEKKLAALANKIKMWKFAVEGTMPWSNAQATAGGIDTSEVNPSTMESKKQPGLFLTGELLDIDGDCGGYNLQWAWSSGYLAGASV